MRLWSIHPQYLDRQGLLAVWREALLAQRVLLQGEYKKCNECSGTGLNPEMGLFSCYKCKGTGKIKTPYYNHSQLTRFKILGKKSEMIRAIGYYLNIIWHEANKRNYKFNFNKIKITNSCPEILTVTKGQLEYEFDHLQKKLWGRDNKRYWENKLFTDGLSIPVEPCKICKKYCNPPQKVKIIEPHPLFKIIDGEVESWEKIK